MRLKQFLNFRLAFDLILGLSLLFHNTSFAQDTANTDTVATTTELESESTTSTSVEAATETKVEPAQTAASSTPAATVEEEGIPTQVYVNFFFYVLLFLLVCFIVGI